jgi:predicted nucleotidyltransferase
VRDDLTIDREQVLARLRDHAAELRRRGVPHAALFGSMARGEAGPDSDIDIIWTTIHHHVSPLATVVAAEIAHLRAAPPAAG